MMRLWILIFLSSSTVFADVLTCEDKTQFASELSTFEKKFKDESAPKSFEELHRLVDADPFFEMGLLLWPGYVSEILPYTDAFEDCAAEAASFIRTIPERSANDRQFKKWHECIQSLYKENLSAAAGELNRCFTKFRRK